jgi:hypothetical protein
MAREHARAAEACAMQAVAAFGRAGPGGALLVDEGMRQIRPPGREATTTAEAAGPARP